MSVHIERMMSTFLLQDVYPITFALHLPSVQVSFVDIGNKYTDRWLIWTDTLTWIQTIVTANYWGAGNRASRGMYDWVGMCLIFSTPLFPLVLQVLPSFNHDHHTTVGHLDFHGSPRIYANYVPGVCPILRGGLGQRPLRSFPSHPQLPLH